MAEKLKTIVDRLLTGLLGDAEHAEQDRPALMLDLLSDWLPYRVYDPTNRLYFNARSKGFVLSVIHEDRMRLVTERFRATGKIEDGVPEIGTVYPDAFDVRHFSSRNMPQRWAPWE